MSIETDIKAAIKGLVYISETDAKFRLVTSKNQRIEVRNFAEWFARETANAEGMRRQKFIELRRLMEENLSGLHVVRIGDIQIDIFIVGTDRNGEVVSIKTKAVDT